MIVIFASAYDESSYSLAARWSAENAAVLTCNDLSLPGWQHHLPLRDDSTAVINGRLVPTREIKGVLIRWPGVFVQELPHIVTEDRDYVAREMMAFLVAWFTQLNCRVVNQPTPVNLCGPAWRPEHWTFAAAQLGLNVRQTERHVCLGIDSSDQTAIETTTHDVTVIGNRSFGNVDDNLRTQSLKLAQAAGTSMLRVSFSGDSSESQFISADLLPQLSAEMADALLEDFLSWEARSN